MSVRVVIRNFQSIEHAELDVQGFTALAGPNNAGKSAVARAIRGAFSNAPAEALVRRGSSDMRVEIHFGDGQSVAWGRDKRPYYEICGAPPIYPGRDVPAEVLALGVRPIQVGADTCWPNFARQFDAPFLADRSGAALAEVVSCPERVALLAQAVKCLEADLRSLRAQVAVQDSEIQRLGHEVVRHGERARAAEVAAVLKHKFQRLVELDQHARRARLMRQRLEVVGEQVNHAARLAAVPVPSKTEVRRLLSRIEQVRGMAAKLQRAEIAARHAAVTALIPIPQRGAIQPLINRSSLLARLSQNLKAADHQVAQASQAVLRAKHEQAGAQAARAELLRGSPMCTLCQRPL